MSDEYFILDGHPVQLIQLHDDSLYEVFHSRRYLLQASSQ